MNWCLITGSSNAEGRWLKPLLSWASTTSVLRWLLHHFSNLWIHLVHLGTRPSVHPTVHVDSNLCIVYHIIWHLHRRLFLCTIGSFDGVLFPFSSFWTCHHMNLTYYRLEPQMYTNSGFLLCLTRGMLTLIAVTSMGPKNATKTCLIIWLVSLIMLSWSPK
jgi:hypothetical protein